MGDWAAQLTGKIPIINARRNMGALFGQKAVRIKFDIISVIGTSECIPKNP